MRGRVQLSKYGGFGWITVLRRASYSDAGAKRPREVLAPPFLPGLYKLLQLGPEENADGQIATSAHFDIDEGQPPPGA